MVYIFRSLFISILAVLGTALWSDQDDLPAVSELPESIRMSSVSGDVSMADSLALRGATLDALARYRAVERQLSTSMQPDEDGLGWIWLKIAELLIQTDQPAAASSQLDMILDRMPDSPWAMQAHHRKGYMLAQAGQYKKALNHLLRAVDHIRGEGAGRLAFRIAYCYQQTGQWEEAVVWYDRSRKTHTFLEDYALYFTAQCLQNLSRSDEAFDRQRRLTRDYPHSLFLTDATVLMCEYLFANGRYDETIAEARTRLKTGHGLTPSDIAIFFAQIGAAHEAAERPDSAMAAYRVILEQYRTTKSALQVLPAYRSIRKHQNVELTDEERLWAGLVYLNHREYGKTVQTLERLARTSPDSGVTPEASYYLGRSQYLTRHYRSAQEEFQRFLNQYPDHDLAASAAFHVARCIRGRQGSSRSLDAYRAFAEAYPDTPMAPDALLYVAQRLEDSGRLTDASKQYRHLATAYPDYEDADEARWHEGYCHYRVKRFEKAAQVFRQLAGEMPSSPYAPQALYWSGKAAWKNNRKAEALTRYAEVVETYPSSYYAYQARLRINALNGESAVSPFKKWSSSMADEMVPPVIDLEAFTARFLLPDSSHGDLAEKIHLDRADALFSVGLREEGVREVQMALDSNPDNPVILARVTRMYFDHRYYREGIREATALRGVLVEQHGQDINSVPIQFLYPAPFWTLVLEEAKTLDIDPLFLLAVMRQESRFDRWIGSWAGARGLMQLMPTTAKPLAKQLRIKNYSAQRLFEPEISISIGSRYMGQLIKRFKGTPELVLAAYNGGPSRVARWVRQRGAGDIDEFIERISIDETRKFVKAVMENYAQYTLFLAQDDTGPASLTR